MSQYEFARWHERRVVREEMREKGVKGEVTGLTQLKTEEGTD